MNLLKPSVEVWQQGDTLKDMWSHITRCTRVCYQSQKKNEAESDENFVKRVILAHKPYNSEANHLTMLEHGTVYLKVPINIDVASNYLDDIAIWTKCHLVQEDNPKDNWWAITTNYRVLVERGWLDDLQYICSPTDHHTKRVTVSFITNIGVTREFNRHRVNSISEESTRYCNYSLGKFNNSVTCVKPAWITEHDMNEINNEDSLIRLDALIKEYGTEFEHDWSDIDYYLFALETCNYCYNNLILKGWKPQQAREVLPLATKSQLIHTAFVDDWKHFFKLRADGVSGAPHPNAKLVAKPLKEKFIELGYIKG